MASGIEPRRVEVEPQPAHGPEEAAGQQKNNVMKRFGG